MSTSSPYTIVITGASDGIGAAAAHIVRSAHPSWRILIHGRNEEKTRRVAREVGADYFLADFAHLDQVRALAEWIRSTTDRIDVLANNAGGIFDGPVTTVDGHEKTFQVNHLAPTVLTHALIDVLTASQAKVVATSSIANWLYGRLDFENFGQSKDLERNRAYGTAKLANILFIQELAARYPQLSPVAYHPGVVATNFSAEAGGLMHRFYSSPLAGSVFGIKADAGGANLAYFIDGTPGIAWERGRYYNDKRRLGFINPQARGKQVRHWEETNKVLGLEW